MFSPAMTVIVCVYICIHMHKLIDMYVSFIKIHAECVRKCQKYDVLYLSLSLYVNVYLNTHIHVCMSFIVNRQIL